MVMKPEPIFEAVEAVGRLHEGESRTIFFAPAGRPFDQALARELSLEQRLVFVCGRYEGFDERVFTLADDVISIGDYVLTGGELPAMVVADAVTRLIPGVLGDDESSVEESFTDGLLEYPQFTRPALYRGLGVPEVLRSGDHAAIAEYRRREAVIRTATVRPDLLARADLTPAERELLSGDPSATPDGEEGTR
jgi:tRNA (guanine37-N1)-methyltransferase